MNSRTQPSQPPSLPLQQLRKLEHTRRPLVTRQISPSGKCRASGVHGAIHIRFAGDLDFVRNERVVGRVVDGESFAGGGGDIGAVDEEIGLEVGGHCCEVWEAVGEFWFVSDWIG
jgi:hypothetical protein